MSDKPIIFSADSVRAILEGRKTMTRRIVKQQSPVYQRCPYQVGQRLWARERAAFYWGAWHYFADGPGAWGPDVSPRAFTSPIYMPKEAARILLEVTGARVERVQEITEEDAKMEGAHFRDFGKDRWGNQCDGWSMKETSFTHKCLGTARFAFANYWNSVNDKRGYGWDVNPFVWVITFRRIHP